MPKRIGAAARGRARAAVVWSHLPPLAVFVRGPQASTTRPARGARGRAQSERSRARRAAVAGWWWTRWSTPPMPRPSVDAVAAQCLSPRWTRRSSSAADRMTAFALAALSSRSNKISSRRVCRSLARSPPSLSAQHADRVALGHAVGAHHLEAHLERGARRAQRAACGARGARREACGDATSAACSVRRRAGRVSRRLVRTAD